MSTIERARLLCGNCRHHTTHELAYAGNILASTTCRRCGHVWQRDISQQYIKDLERRVRAKPRRMLRQLRRHPLTYSLTVVKQLAVKPLHIWEEITVAAHSRTAHQPTKRPCESRGNKE